MASFGAPKAIRHTLGLLAPHVRQLTSTSPLHAREELKKLGPLSRNEKITAGALAVTVGLWIFGGQIGVNAVAAALLGLAVLLITNVVRCGFGLTELCHAAVLGTLYSHEAIQHMSASALLASQQALAQHRLGIVWGLCACLALCCACTDAGFPCAT